MIRRQSLTRSERRRMMTLLGGTALAFLVVIALIARWENERFATGSDEIGSAVIAAEQQCKEVRYQGVLYRQRQQVTSYLIMGIDVAGKAVGVDSYEGGGQADAQMLLVLDDVNETWQVLQINRDSMVKVPILAVNGSVFGYDTQQIALAHYYGDGREQSCENAVRAVSMMLDDQPIDGYAAINMDAVEILTDLVEGVPLEVLSDFSKIDPTLVQGETICLTGKQALTYVRSRYDVDDQTNLARMQRQQQYIAALQQVLQEQDAQFVLDAYDALRDYMVTDMGSGTVSRIAEKMKRYRSLGTLTIQGENKVLNGHWAYELDEESLQQTILTLFYETTEEEE